MAAPAPAAGVPMPGAPGGGAGVGALPAINPAVGIVTHPSDPNGGMLGNAFRAAAQFPEMQQQAMAAKIKLQQQQQSFAQQQVDTLSQLVNNNPDYANNPQVAQRASSLFQTLGLPPPLTADGRLDIAAFGAGPKDWNLLSETDKSKYYEMPTEQRAAYLKSYRNVPGDILTAKQLIPQATIRAEMNDMTRLLTSPNVADYKSATAIIQSSLANGTAKPEDIAAYQTGSSQRWESQFQLKKAALTNSQVKESDLVKWHGEQIKIDQEKVDAVKSMNTARIRQADDRIKQSGMKLQLEAQRTAAYVNTSNAKVKMATNMLQSKNSSMVLQARGILSKEKIANEAAQARLIAADVGASTEADHTKSDEMLNVLQAAHAQLDQSLQSYGSALDGAVGNSLTRQMGHEVKVTGGKGGTTHAGSQYGTVTGQAQMHGKTYYQYQDGTIREAGSGALVDKDGNPTQ